MKKSLLLIIVLLITLTGCSSELDTFEQATNNMNELESFQMNIKVKNKENGIAQSGYAKVTNDYIYFSGTEVYRIVFINGESQRIVPFYHTYVLIDDNTFNLTEEVPVVEFGSFTNVTYDKVNNRYLVEGTVEDFDDVDELIIKINDSYVTYVEFESTIDGTLYNFVLEFSEFDMVEMTPPTYISDSEKNEFESYIQRIGFFHFYDNGENLGLEFDEGEVSCRLSTNTCVFDTSYPIELNIRDMTVTSDTLGISTPISYQEHRADNDVLQAVFDVIMYYYSQFE